jgi:hypothetical protein
MGKMEKTTTRTGRVHDYIWNLPCILTDDSEYGKQILTTKAVAFTYDEGNV